MSSNSEGAKGAKTGAEALHLEDLIMCSWALRAAAQDAVRDYLKAKRGPKSFRVHAAPFLRLAKNYGRTFNRVSAAMEQERVNLIFGGSR